MVEQQQKLVLSPYMDIYELVIPKDSLLRQMKELDNASIIKFHYVDDNIITGKTYFRAKSIVETIVDQYRKQEGDFPVVIFDRVFTLIDRNSKGTRMQYIKSGTCLREVDNYFYFFIRLEISSLRNYGDSCIVCNLYRESQQLHNAAATRVVSEYWEKSSNAKFCITPWEIGRASCRERV